MKLRFPKFAQLCVFCRRTRYEDREVIIKVNLWDDNALRHVDNETEMELMIEDEWKKYGACPLDRLRDGFENRWNANWQFICGQKIFNDKFTENGVTSRDDFGAIQFRIVDESESHENYYLLVLRTTQIVSNRRKFDGSLCKKCRIGNEKTHYAKV